MKTLAVNYSSDFIDIVMKGEDDIHLQLSRGVKMQMHNLLYDSVHSSSSYVLLIFDQLGDDSNFYKDRLEDEN